MARVLSPLLKWATRPYAEAEGGLHTDVFRAAIMLLESGHDQSTVFDFLRRAADKVTDRHVPDRELLSAIRYASARLGGDRVSVRWPKFESAYRAEIVAKFGNLLPSLVQSSETLDQHPATYLRQLYAPGALVCVAMSSSIFLTMPRDVIASADNVTDVEYVNPSPMIAPTGLTQEGIESAHCLNNTGDKVYQVVEFDFGSPVEHAAILWHLGAKLPLVLIVYSGGKSLHGWFNVRHLPEAVVQNFFAEAVTLGADPKMWSKCQFSRLPGGTNHKTRRRQSIVLFNPSLLT